MIKGKNGQPIGTVVKLPNGKKVLKPIAVPGATPSGTPTVFPSKSTGQTGPTPHKSTGQAPAISPSGTPSIKAPVGTVIKGKNGQPIGTVVKLPNGKKVLKPIAVPGAIPGMVPNVKPNATPTQKNTKPGFFDRIENYFRGDQEKVIEPGIRNKEVEAYRTDDAKEVIYKDGIKQDDKNVTLPSKNRK